MKRLSALLLVFTMVFYISCTHDTSELEKTRDTALSDVIPADSLIQDILSYDINDDIFDAGPEDTDFSDSADIYIDSGAEEIPVADISDTDFTGDIEDVTTDVLSEEIQDTGYPDADASYDIISTDAVCKNECEKSGVRTCLKIDDKEYVSECKDVNEDGCLEWVNVEFCKYGCAESFCNNCLPDCTNKECDSDGCEGSCGICNKPPPNYCKDNKLLVEYNNNGTCSNYKCVYNYSEITCEYACENGLCTNCNKNCTNKVCGSDGCGGVCGVCNELQFCNALGLCECLYEICNGVCCKENEVCFNSSCCLPDCIGKECGPDKCGGSCGACESLSFCKQGICEQL